MSNENFFNQFIESTFTSSVLFSREEMSHLFENLFKDQLSEIRIASVLTILRVFERENPQLILWALDVLLKQLPASVLLAKSVDFSGVGSNYKDSSHIIFAASLIACSAGAKVSLFNCGQNIPHNTFSEILQIFGIKNSNSLNESLHELQKSNIAFTQIGHVYPAFKHLLHVRRTLGFHTLLDVLLPFAHPSRITGQIISTHSKKLLPVVAESLVLAGRERGLAFITGEGTAHLSLRTYNDLYCVDHGKITRRVITPENISMHLNMSEELSNLSIDEIITEVTRILNSNYHPKRGDNSSIIETVLLNAGAMLWAAGLVETIEDGISIAKNCLKSGKAMQKLNTLKDKCFDV